MGAAQQWDVIVVGSRVAGAATALQLARAGWRTLLVDRAKAGSDTVCTTFLQSLAVDLLRAWGLLDRLRESGCPPIDSFTVRTATEEFTMGLYASTYAPRRAVLDNLVTEAASEAGAELRHEFLVTELDHDGGRVVGVKGHGIGGGQPVTERARWVIGADGGRSAVARLVAAPEYESRRSLGPSWHSYWSGVPLDGFRFAVATDGTALGAAPTNDGLSSIFVGLNEERAAGFRADPDRSFAAAAAAADPVVAQSLSAKGKREARWFVAGETPAWFRRPYGPGWALVGDSGFRQWPSTGHGITDAFRDAALLADALTDISEGRRSEVEALRAYEQTRNTLSVPLFEAAHGPTAAPELSHLPKLGLSYGAAIAQEAMRGLPNLQYDV